jgi:hypothetical protein
MQETVNPAQSAYPESSYISELTYLYGAAYHQGINNTGALMNFKLSTLAAAAALLVNCSAPVMAAGVAVPIGKVGGWDISRSPTWCSGQGEFANGTFLTFNIATTGAATINISSGNWDIPKGDYPVVVSIDRMPPVTFTGEADGVVIRMGWKLTPDEINLFSNGAVFRAKVGRASYEYGLNDSAGMLRAVIKCVSDLKDVANPFAGQPSASAPPTNPFPETTSNPYRRM